MQVGWEICDGNEKGDVQQWVQIFKLVDDGSAFKQSDIIRHGEIQATCHSPTPLSLKRVYSFRGLTSTRFAWVSFIQNNAKPVD